MQQNFLMRPVWFVFLVAFFSSWPVAAEPPEDAEPGTATAGQNESGKDGAKWYPLWNGRDLKGWKKTNFGGEGPVTVKQGVLVLAAGSSLTGVTYTGLDPESRKPVDPGFKLPLANYEIRLTARRVEGTDFFCGLTFPYKNTHASLILGGWGGSICGISCLDYYDASENETTRYQKFEKGRWYRVRLRVTDENLEAWIDDELFIETQLAGRKVDVRSEVELSRPLGLASFDTTAEIRQLEIRRLADQP